VARILPAAGLLLSLTGFARAAEVTRVIAGAEGQSAVPDVSVAVSWLREDRTAVLERELQAAATGGRTALVRDLVYRQTRHLLALRADVGLFRDLGLYVSAPIVLADDRWLEFDRRADECDLLTGEGAAGASPLCVNETSSTLLRDGVLPAGPGGERYGLDAEDERPFERPSRRVFRGPTRRGLAYLGVGLQWAAMNQRRDATKPTWLLRVEPRFALGKEMGFDPAAPTANRGVNPGYHELHVATILSRRFSRFDPYLGGWFGLALAGDDSAYGRFPRGRKGFGSPQHQGGAEAGFEYVSYEDERRGHKLTVELRGTMEVRFFGLARSQLWEPLSGPGTCAATPATCRPELDTDLDGDGKPEPYPGITRSPSYGVFGGAGGLNATVARVFRLRALVGVSAEQNRFLSDGRSGVEIVDAPGRRYRVEDARSWSLYLEGAAVF
jgi:hypothetical protein